MVPELVITVFGSSRPEAGDPAYEEARALGQALARSGLAVCSGGYSGVMEAVSRGAKEAGGRTYGVTTDFFSRPVNAWIDVELRKRTWEERLFSLVQKGDGFVACRGGTGTLLELALVWEMQNKAMISRKPLVVLGEFWRPVLDRIRGVEPEGSAGTAESRVAGVVAGNLVHCSRTAEEAARFLTERLRRGTE